MKTPDAIRVWPDFPAKDNWCGGVWDNSNGPHGVDYIRADPAVILAAARELPEFKALVEAAVDGKQALMDAADEIAELRLALSKLDLELPWISDAIDQLTTALAALKPDAKE